MDKYDLIELALLNPSLDYATMTNFGFTPKQIDKFIKEKFLYRVKDLYYINNVELIEYYNKNHKYMTREQQKLLLDLSLSMEPNNIFVLKLRLLLALRMCDYKTALFCFERIYPDMKKKLTSDAYTFLLLMAKVIELPEDLKQDLDRLEKDDLLLGPHDLRKYDMSNVNEARMLIFDGNIREAYSTLYNKTYKVKKLILEEELLRLLLKRAQEEIESHNPCEELVYQNRFEEALDAFDSYKWSSVGRKMIKDLLEFIVNPPENINVELNHKDTLGESIMNYDFIAAYNIHLRYMKDTERDNVTTNMIKHLLKYIVYNFVLKMDMIEKDKELIDNDPNIYKIVYISCLMEQANLSFEDALKISNLDDDSKNYIILNYASYAFKNGNEEFGDRILKQYNLDDYKEHEFDKDYHRIKEARNLYIEQTKEYYKSLNKVNVDLCLPFKPENK